MFNWFSKLFHNGTPNARFFSQFGGMWIDCHDFSERLNMKIQSNRITENEADDIRKFEKNGYIIFQNAIPSADCDRLLNYFEASFASGNDQLIIQAPEEKGGRRRVQKGEQFKEQRIVDVYMIENAAREILLNSKIERFLEICFEAPPMLFQSLSFVKGSNQALHQDTEFVVTNRPMELIASWIALEDVQPGSGELMYVLALIVLRSFYFPINTSISLQTEIRKAL